MKTLAIIASLLLFQFSHARVWELKKDGESVEGEIFRATKLSLILTDKLLLSTQSFILIWKGFYWKMGPDRRVCGE